jgi:hypothetical protein
VRTVPEREPESSRRRVDGDRADHQQPEHRAEHDQIERPLRERRARVLHGDDLRTRREPWIDLADRVLRRRGLDPVTYAARHIAQLRARGEASEQAHRKSSLEPRASAGQFSTAASRAHSARTIGRSRIPSRGRAGPFGAIHSSVNPANSEACRLLNLYCKGETNMSTTAWIVVLLLVFLLIGGGGYFYRR